MVPVGMEDVKGKYDALEVIATLGNNTPFVEDSTCKLTPSNTSEVLMPT